MTDALDAEWPGRFGLKWPNDVLLDGLKVCGILVEVVGSGDAVIGSGLNLWQTADQLPTPTATSLELGRLPVDEAAVDRVVAGYLGRLRQELSRPTADLRERVAARCLTIGRRVRIELPSAPPVEGSASGIDGDGRLEVLTDAGDSLVVAVGDVIHVRAV
jgi:BirA family biotin operon repressor/biotin-[acetyl-CoA-carboxylase] ligase